jgi:hypothetical protein
MKTFRHGTPSQFGTHHPGYIMSSDGESSALMVYGIPMNCQREEIEKEPRYAARLQAIDKLTEIMNLHAAELQGLFE